MRNKYQIDEKTRLLEEQVLPYQHAINDIKLRYGTAEQFLLTFNKDIQPKTAKYLERTYLGVAPTLQKVKEAYSSELLRVWIMAQLEDLNDYCGLTIKLRLEQMEEIANIIGAEYYYLKVTELHLFFYRLKAGSYGFFYGSIDPMKLMTALVCFLKERRVEIHYIEDQLEQDRLNKLREVWKQTSISYTQYTKLKEEKHEIRK